jgi:myo-inositol-1(or 4)-monophosphatase
MTLSDTLLQDWRLLAERLADAAGAAILPHFRALDGVENKAARGFDPVTVADRAAEAAMRALIEAAAPDHGIIGEEYPEKPSANGWSWVLDPIDGTRAFISGLPLWGVLIALCHEGRPVLGVLDQPYLKERYRGFPGGAEATIRGRTTALQVRPCPDLRDAAIATTDPHLFTPAEAGGFEQVRQTARLARYGCDCYAYGMVAAGHLDLVIESGLKAHDIAALVPIIEGAGGLVSNWRGGPAWSGGQVIAAGDARARDEALIALRRAAS